MLVQHIYRPTPLYMENLHVNEYNEHKVQYHLPCKCWKNERLQSNATCGVHTLLFHHMFTIFSSQNRFG